MTAVSIRISASTTGASTPATGMVGAFGGRVPGASDDTTIEVTIEELKTMGDAVVAIEGALPAAATAFNTITGPTIEAERAPQITVNVSPNDATPVEADVLEDAGGVDERAEKKRRKAQRKAAVSLITPMVRKAHTTDQDWDEDAKVIVKTLETEGFIR